MLKDDGTFTVEGKEDFGAYFIKENTITFLHKKHIRGPDEDEPIYAGPEVYGIKEDCSSIRYMHGDTGALLVKQN